MALLTPALKDRARPVRSIGSGPRIEGRRQAVQVADQWRPARLVTGDAREVLDHDRQRILEVGTLLISGADVLTSDEYEVQSRSVGAGRWKVSGPPQVVITRRLGRASLVPVERMVEPPPSELAA